MLGRPLPAADGGSLPERIRQYLGRLLGNDAFVCTPQRRKLLEYVVEQTLNGRGERLKAFDLAVSVLGRNERFDPQKDPIVRIEMGRLRRDLDHYYEADGRDDPIRISIPKGQYVPTFAVRNPADDPAPPLAHGPGKWGRTRLRAAAAVLGLLVLATVVWHGWGLWRASEQAQAPGPAVVVLPLEVLSGGEGGRLLATGLTGGLISDLMRFDGLQVFAGVPASHGEVTLPPAAAGAPAYVIAGSVEREPNRAVVTARLTDRASGQVLWSQAYERPLTTTAIYDVEAELTAAIVGRLAQVYGVITEATNGQLRQARPETLFAYDCVQQAFAYRQTSSLETHAAVEACLDEAVRRDPGYASAWAMLAFAHLDAVRFGLVEPAKKTSEMQAGLTAAQRAIELAPNSVPALQAMAALRYGTGDYDQAERLQRQAIALNPQNPESLAQLGWRLVVRGRWQEGNGLLQQAIERSVVVPNWYHTSLGVGLYLAGEPEPARAAAEAGKAFCCGLGQAVLAITEAVAGHATAAQTALAEAKRQAPVLERDPRALWAAFQFSDDVVDRLVAGLQRAGLAVAGAG